MIYVYILHFDRRINPNHPCQHYIGCTIDLDNRIRQHRSGSGSRLCQVAKERGIGFRLAEVLKGDRKLERLLKRQRNAPRYCPLCQRSV